MQIPPPVRPIEPDPTPTEGTENDAFEQLEITETLDDAVDPAAADADGV